MGIPPPPGPATTPPTKATEHRPLPFARERSFARERRIGLHFSTNRSYSLDARFASASHCEVTLLGVRALVTASTHTGQNRPRRFRRRVEGALPFLPWGLVPFGGLLLVFLSALTVGAQFWVERSVRTTVRRTLHDAGLEDIKLSVSGQYVLLEGSLPEGTDESALKNLVSQATSFTWVGDLTPIALVESNFQKPKTKTSTQAPSMEVRDFVFRRIDNVMVLEGVVSSAPARDALLDRAQGIIGRSQTELVGVKDQLTIDHRVVGSGLAAAEWAIDVLEHCQEGRFTAKERKLKIICVISEDGNTALQALVERKAPTAYDPPTINLLKTNEVAECNQRLADVITKNLIEFDTGTATLRPQSGTVMDKVAEAIKTCPGTLVIEGHTDDIGDSASNRVLSQTRAQSVLEALAERSVEATRMVAVGFGETRPLEDNTTKTGRERNRRIEIHVQSN